MNKKPKQIKRLSDNNGFHDIHPKEDITLIVDKITRYEVMIEYKDIAYSYMELLEQLPEYILDMIMKYKMASNIDSEDLIGKLKKVSNSDKPSNEEEKVYAIMEDELYEPVEITYEEIVIYLSFIYTIVNIRSKIYPIKSKIIVLDNEICNLDQRDEYGMTDERKWELQAKLRDLRNEKNKLNDKLYEIVDKAYLEIPLPF